MAERSILAVAYSPAGGTAQVRKAVGGFLRYVQYRDQHPDGERPPAVEGLLKYVAFRDRSGQRGQLFDLKGRAGDIERRRLASFVERSLKASRPQLSQAPNGRTVDRRRAVYRMVLSPEFADGLDLKALTVACMGRLQWDVGGEAPLVWLAAEHRNTAHPHVHIVLAGMRETEPDRFRSVVVNRRRLAAMKEAILLEIERQREVRPLRERASGSVRPAVAAGPVGAAAISVTGRKPAASLSSLGRPANHQRLGARPATPLPAHRHSWVSLSLRRMAWRYRRETDQLVEEERRRLEREGGR